MSAIFLLLPSLAPIQESLTETPIVAHWLACADRLANELPGRNQILRSLFQFPGKNLPIAALTRQFDVGDAGNDLWLHADPAFFYADMAVVRMLACGNMDITKNQANAFLSSLKPLFGDAGFLLEDAISTRWYLRCSPVAAVPEFAAPEDVLGKDLSHYLPSGTEGQRWRRLHNEAQIILHNHSANAERIARGAVPINGLWFWGGGKLPDWVATNCDAITSKDPVLCALAQQAGITAQPRSQESIKMVPASQVILDLADMRNADVLNRDWLVPLLSQLRQKPGAQILCMFESGERYLIRLSHRWRFWRRIRTFNS